MWNDLRVDGWFYAILGIDLIAFSLFVLRSARWRPLYLAAPVNLLAWYLYERSIVNFLAAGVPIRLDFPFVVVLAFFPIFPVLVHASRLNSKQDR